ncbi:pyridoxamine 5'-phosphate oxidase [Lentilitoribacter sp. Alg239-R112]|uniref:pyridoxamine 5'-phosphate oxidase n=1 Tax=Lentilitoribacter sp. Alg239-R112 TaxID=2305987 RepID=UPI0013A6F4B7|nr:pyridoxamine 5'-phosphate oxidase [Lentilitoribacter sp. Alg239-R112]
MTEKMLTNNDFTQSDDPFELFATWMADADASEPNDPNAMSVATVDEDGMPNVRILLLKDFSVDGFTFYTNFESTKGLELLASKKASLCFHWKSLRRQVRIRGGVTQVSEAEADEYYNSRPRGSRVGAWASAQSRELSERSELEGLVNQFTEKFGDGDIPRPSHWSGFRLTPLSIEFWHDRPYRLHDRIVFERAASSDDWTTKRLFP